MSVYASIFADLSILSGIIERNTPLTRTQARIVARDSVGMDHTHILDDLDITHATMKTHWRNIYRAMGAPNRRAVRAMIEVIVRAYDVP